MIKLLLNVKLTRAICNVIKRYAIKRRKKHFDGLDGHRELFVSGYYLVHPCKKQQLDSATNLKSDILLKKQVTVPGGYRSKCNKRLVLWYSVVQIGPLRIEFRYRWPRIGQAGFCGTARTPAT